MKKLALLFFALTILGWGQSQNMNIVTLIPSTDNTGTPVATGELLFRDLQTALPHYVGIRGPATVGTNTIWTWMDHDVAGALCSDGLGHLSIGTCAGAGSLPVPDFTIITQNAADPTKQMRFDNSQIAAGNTSVLGIQPGSYTLAGIDITNMFTADQDFSGSIKIYTDFGPPPVLAWVINSGTVNHLTFLDSTGHVRSYLDASGIPSVGGTGVDWVMPSLFVQATTTDSPSLLVAPRGGSTTDIFKVVDSTFATKYLWVDNAGVTHCASGCGGSTLPVIDSTIITQNAADPTKQMRFNDAAITTGHTRVLTLQDTDYTLAGTDIANTFSLNQTFGNDIIMTGPGGGTAGSIDFDNPTPGIGAIKFTIPSAGGSIYTFTLPPDGGTSNYVLRTNGGGTTTWNQVNTLINVPFTLFNGAGVVASFTTASASGWGLFAEASGSGGGTAIFAKNDSGTGTSGHALDVEDDAVNATAASIHSAANGEIGLDINVSGVGAEAAHFHNGSSSGTTSTLLVENDGGGVGQGSAALFIGSVTFRGSNSGNNMTYDGPGNGLTISDVSGNQAFFNSSNINLAGNTATNSFFTTSNSSGYHASLGFITATVPALAGGTIASSVTFPLPSNTATAGLVLVAGGSTSPSTWQPGCTGAWTAYTPSVTGLSSFTSDSAYCQAGTKTYYVRISVTGTGSGSFPTFTLPFTAKNGSTVFAGYTIESGATQQSMCAAAGSTTTLTGLFSSFGSSNNYSCGGVYEIN